MTTLSTSPSPAAAPAPSGPMHGCVRCGARIPIDESMCERCNPLGLEAPSASQAHGTVVLSIVAAVVLLAVIARFAISGVGPFTATLEGVASDPLGVAVTITLTNDGSSAASTTCRVADPALPGVGPETAFILSPILQPGETRTFTTVITSLGREARPLDIACGR